MRGTIIESFDVRYQRRLNVIQDIFVGCVLEFEDIYDEDDRVSGEAVHIKRVFGRAKKSIAHMIWDHDPKRGFIDEFRVPYYKSEPLVLIAIDQFYEQGIQRLAPHMPEIVAIAEYPLQNREYDGFVKKVTETKSGRVDALLEYIETYDEDQDYMRERN